MKTIMDDKKIIVFFNNKELDNIDLKDNEITENYFKKIFLKLNKKYNIDLNGYYEIEIYKDNNYGFIIEFTYEDLDYYNYFNQIDMKINISNINCFLYEIKYEFLNKEILKNCICYQYLDKLYLKILDLNNNYFNLLELSNIIYGDKVNEILRYGKKVNL